MFKHKSKLFNKCLSKAQTYTATHKKVNKTVNVLSHKHVNTVCNGITQGTTVASCVIVALAAPIAIVPIWTLIGLNKACRKLKKR